MVDTFLLKEDGGKILLEDGFALLLEREVALAITTVIYEIEGGADLRERAAFKYEFPQKLFVVLE